jgi:hypothetical protein
MKKLTFLLLITLSHCVTISAQEIEGWIKSKKPILFEKLYLHVDRELYAVGDRIWLKAYEVNGITHQLNSNLRNIFVQLVAEDGHVLKDRLLFSANGQAIGDFKTDSLNSGMYTIRAFTKYLEHFGEEAYFHKKIWIAESFKLAKTDKKDLSDDPKIELTFLPEGGNMVLNATNTVAFKAIDSKGSGIYATGRIMDDLGDTIVAFSTSYRGMGKLMMMPVDERTYYATVDRHPELKIELPKATPDGISLNYRDLGEFLQFTLSSNMKMDDQPPFYFMASHKGTVVSKEIEMYDFTETVTLDKKLFPNGISKITLLDTLMRPFAERLIFVDDGTPDMIKLQPNKQEYIPREEVTISAEALLEPGDSIKSTLSVAVVNKSYFGPDGNSQNIKSYLLLDSELKGAIESPASYFVSDRFHSSAEKLDLLMMVNGWRSYFWDDVEANKTANQEDWNDVGINISGYVKKLLWKEPQAEAEVKMDYVYNNFQLAKTITDKNGRFNFDRIYYNDSAKVMLNARTKGGTRNLEIMLDPDQKMDSVVTVDLLRKTCFDVGPNIDFIRDNSFRQLKELEFNPEKGTILLEGVDVIAQSALIRSWGAYPYADKTLRITKKDYRFGSLIRYLQDTLTGLTDYGDGLKYKNKNVSFMVGGMAGGYDLDKCRLSDIEFIDIAIVTVVNTTPYSMTGKQNFASESAIIAIYLKPFAERTNYSIYDYVKGRAIIRTKGYHQALKFYSPQYTLDNINNPKPDYRPTLFWEPELKFEHGKSNIDFYTSDELADYVVFVEGISKAGKICYGTTNFTVK